MTESLGGQLVSKLDASVSAVISSQGDVDKMNKKMKEIKQLSIPVVAEGESVRVVFHCAGSSSHPHVSLTLCLGFLDACKEGKPAQLVKTYKISDWGNDLEKAFTDVVDAKKPMKSAAVRAAEARDGMSF